VSARTSSSPARYETSSGGPFFRDIDNQGSAQQEVYFVDTSRTGFYGTLPPLPLPTVIWSIGTVDGTPTGFLIADNAHPLTAPHSHAHVHMPPCRRRSARTLRIHTTSSFSGGRPTITVKPSPGRTETPWRTDPHSKLIMRISLLKQITYLHDRILNSNFFLCGVYLGPRRAV
jgi:hypothetical protein